MLRWMSRRNIHFKLDSAHPKAAAHHQKIVVIDDVIAFCGGIDITADRWDTREHRDEDPRRVRPTTKRRYGPWHDATGAVDGHVARALGDLARSRWKSATGDELAPPPPTSPIWPKGLEPHLWDIDVAIARTLPEYGDQREVREVEAFYLAAIAAAQRSIYIESQYFASRRIAEAMANRLREPAGPEIVVVNPESADGWLEEAAMGSARARLLRMIREVDAHHRFRIYSPVTEGGEPIYVHAKIMTVDDRLLRLGSSNLNNRSMGYDTECDLIVDADRQGRPPEVAASIRRFRTDLLSEHLGKSTDEVEAALAHGSLIRAIEALRGPRRSLRPFQPDTGLFGETLAESDLLDPEGVA